MSKKTITIDEIREIINNYYRNHDAESFFAICNIHDSLKAAGVDHPIMTEMSNIIVMG